mgnify:CR=1 FL=1
MIPRSVPPSPQRNPGYHPLVDQTDIPGIGRIQSERSGYGLIEIERSRAGRIDMPSAECISGRRGGDPFGFRHALSLCHLHFAALPGITVVPECYGNGFGPTRIKRNIRIDRITEAIGFAILRLPTDKKITLLGRTDIRSTERPVHNPRRNLGHASAAVETDGISAALNLLGLLPTCGSHRAKHQNQTNPSHQASRGLYSFADSIHLPNFRYFS